MATPESDQAKDALAELHVELRLDEALRAMAIEDIKAPLTEVSLSASAAERLATGAADPRLAEAIRDIRESVARASSLLAGLSDESGAAVDLRVADVAPLLAVCGRAVQPLARSRGVRVESDPAVNGVRGLCDRIRTVRAVVTLLCMALRRSREGDVVRLALASGEAGVRVSVHDGGAVLGDEAIEALLSPTLRASEALPTRDLGRARRAVVAQGGHMRVRREADGMSFEVILPLPPGR